MTYTSKDFSVVSNSLKVNLPEKLLHKGVCTNQTVDTKFNEERQHFVGLIDLPSKSLSVTIGKLDPLQSTRRHRHNYETIIYVVSGRGYSLIEDTEVHWESGDAIYVPVWAWHNHVNLSDSEECCYVACENATLLQNLGGIALREEI